jgi:hypothetical protein
LFPYLFEDFSTSIRDQKLTRLTPHPTHHLIEHEKGTILVAHRLHGFEVTLWGWHATRRGSADGLGDDYGMQKICRHMTYLI